MHIRFYLKKKLKTTSKEDVDPFLFWEKFRSASKEDADQFSLRKNHIYI